jgi:hypothetical protein
VHVTVYYPPPEASGILLQAVYWRVISRPLSQYVPHT